MCSTLLKYYSFHQFLNAPLENGADRGEAEEDRFQAALAQLHSLIDDMFSHIVSSLDASLRINHLRFIIMKKTLSYFAW